jgi:integrase
VEANGVWWPPWSSKPVVRQQRTVGSIPIRFRQRRIHRRPCSSINPLTFKRFIGSVVRGCPLAFGQIHDYDVGNGVGANAVPGKLTALGVAKLKVPGMYGDGGGLWLQVTGNGAKSWIFRFTLGGKSREMGLGSAGTFPLAEARDKALTCRKLCYEGIDPIEARRQQRQAAALESARAMTFRQCAAAYIESHKAGWRNEKHGAQWLATLEAYVHPIFGDLSVQAVDTGLVIKAIEPIWTTKPETAVRVRGRIESILDWAKARGFRAGENPARWRGHLQNLLPRKTKIQRVTHHPALPFAEVPEFLRRVAEQPGIAARLLKFTVLTAARTGEALGARWCEFDLAAGTWTVPAERMKGGVEHRVPISAATQAILTEMAVVCASEFVFPGGRYGRPLSNMAMLVLLRRMDRSDLTVHGFRSSFRDWASEITHYPSEVVEMALAHVVESKVERAYRRGDLFEKRRELMDDWANFCEIISK